MSSHTSSRNVPGDLLSPRLLMGRLRQQGVLPLLGGVPSLKRLCHDVAMSSWGTCGFGGRAHRDENNHGLPDTEKIAIGQRCKMALDIGRMLYLQQHGFFSKRCGGTSLALLGEPAARKSLVSE